MLPRTFAGVHYHQFLYQRSISLKSLFYFDVNRDFCWCAFLSISLPEKHNSSEPVLFWCYHRDFCWYALTSISLHSEAYLLRACSILMLIGTFAGEHYHQFLYERSISLQSLFYIDINRNFCWCALRINFFTREA